MERFKGSSIDEYIRLYPPGTRKILQEVRRAIRSVAPDARETISYGIPTFTLNGNLVHFAGFEKHIGFYPTPSGISAFKRELAAYASAKGSVRFPLSKPVPIALIKRIVKYRVAEQLRKTKHGPKRSAR